MFDYYIRGVESFTNEVFATAT